ncbi:MAG: hypothetical protein ABIJ97_12810 [Bacteroidota bacterium]
MRTKYYIKERNEEPRQFFIECSDKIEVFNKILPFIKKENLENIIEKVNMFAEDLSSEWKVENRLNFIGVIVKEDLSLIEATHSHHPMHQFYGAYSPYDEIEPVEIESLNDLKYIQVKFVCHMGLRD